MLRVKADAEVRVKAFELFNQLKNQGLSKSEIIRKVTVQYAVPYQTVYGWLSGKWTPFGKKRIQYRPELFYVLGALLGDGYLYAWKAKSGWRIIGVVGEKEFIDKYAKKLSLCIGRKIRGYINRSKNVWFLNAKNIELYFLFKEIRENREKVNELLKVGNYKQNSLNLVEGYFDAEGCVKIIKEKIRKTPKICLDFCSTDFLTLELMKKLLRAHLNIEARYSAQKQVVGKFGTLGKKAYHLRIYKKEFVKNFFENIRTTKLKPAKVSYVENWLSNKNNEKFTFSLLDNSALQSSS